MRSTDIPIRYKETFASEFENRFLVYNPSSRKGVVLLRKDAYYLYSLIDGKRNIETLTNKLNKSGIDLSLDRLVSFFEYLEKNELIYIENPKTYEKIVHFKPKTIYVWVHLTNQCNLRCTYCFVNKTPETMPIGTLRATINKVFETAVRNQLHTAVIIFSGGEPMLQFNSILEGADLAKKLSKKTGVLVSLEIMTNGVLMTKEAADAIKKKGMIVSISLDGLEKYNNLTRPFANGLGSFKYVKRGIFNAKRAGILEHINITLTSKNLLHSPALIRYCIKNGIRFCLQYFGESQYAEKGLRLNDRDLLKTLGNILKIVQKSLPRYQLWNDLSNNVTFDNPKFGCGASMNTYFVARHDGKISSCNWDMNKTIGSIHRGDIMETLNKGSYIKPILSLKKKVSCTTCRWRFICSSCPLHFINHKNSLTPPYCKVNKVLIPKLLRLEASRLLKYKSPRSSLL